jgi:hypothetical protein
MARKIVQIAVTHAPPEGDRFAERLFALCNDGSVWRYSWGDRGTGPACWIRLGNIPQDDTDTRRI